MKAISLPVLAGCVCTSFAIGFAVAWQMQSTNDATPSSTNVALQAQPQTGQNPVADIWRQEPAATNHERTVTPTVATADAIDTHKLHEQAMADPAFLRSLIQRYDTERNQTTKDALRSVLTSIPKPEAKEFVTRLATSSDAAQRKEGYEILKQGTPDSPEVRNLLRKALASEQSPAALTQAIAAMRPAVVDPTESEAIIGQLRGLTQHADPAVRSQSVLQLGQWDKDGTSQESLASALNDPAPEVRQSAIFAIAQSGSRSDSLKTALLAMINSPSEGKNIKGSALQVLERFSLNKEEYASFAKARAQFGF